MDLSEKKNLKLIVAYDGQGYLGWQKTDTGPSIENALQTVLEQIFQEPITLQAASRTDAGVHARGQVVNFYTSKLRTSLPRLQASLNGLLPSDIAVLQVTEEPFAFHPTLDCLGKEYHYTISHGSTQLPQHRFYSWHYPYSLDPDAMRAAARAFVGEHDFSAFCNFQKNASYTDWIRSVSDVSIIELPEHQLQISVKGNHFLYKMVRNIVGTLAQVGRGLIASDAIPQILASRDRTQAGLTAPACGLCLFRVFYP